VTPAPHVSVLVAVSNGERHLEPALTSIARQTVSGFELIVVDDGSTDATPVVLDGFADPRLRVVRNDERLGLAAALNRGLEVARGRYVARMDADDLALPFWLERVLARIADEPPVALVGAGIVELGPGGRLGAAHLPEPGPAVTRWYSHFAASPFFHNTVVFERELFERHGLRYDESFGESEDYELWTRVLQHAEADALAELLVLYRIHPEQASQRRAELQRELGRKVALAQIAATAPGLAPAEAELAWRFGHHRPLASEEVEEAGAAYVALVDAFCRSDRYSHDELGRVRWVAAKTLSRRATAAPGAARARLVRRALALDPAAPAHAASRRAHRALAVTRFRRDAAALVRADLRRDGPIRVAAVFPEPTPYRAPLLDRVAALPEVELTVLYAAGTVAGRTWRVQPMHEAVFLRGLRVPGADRVLHHDYPLTPGVISALSDARPDVVVVSGWSTFAAQSAIAWCRLRNVPYVLVVESHDEGPRPGWRRTVKKTVVPPVVRNASGVLVTGTLARNSMVARGARPERVRIFANTVDVDAFAADAARLAPSRPELRATLGAGADDVVVLSVARLAPEKGLDVLVGAVAGAGDDRLLLLVAGDGPEQDALRRLAEEAGTRLVLLGDVEWERIVELYVAGDVFALLSQREPWAVVVNEAAACGLPLVLSDRVGAAHDLLRDGENGFVVPAGDAAAASAALRALAADPALRRAQGARSRELARDWGYGPSVEGFLEAVREAVEDRS
jgi:glycosyltransferase involved in cell wall biosynthesis/GT2 family glycosyltransferase